MSPDSLHEGMSRTVTLAMTPVETDGRTKVWRAEYARRGERGSSLSGESGWYRWSGFQRERNNYSAEHCSHAMVVTLWSSPGKRSMQSRFIWGEHWLVVCARVSVREPECPGIPRN